MDDRDDLGAAAGPIGRRLGSAVVTVRAVAVGDARATYRLTLADGRTFAVRGVSGDGAQHRVDTMRRHMARFAAAGLPVPPAVTVKAGESWWLVTPWVDGARGSTWLDAPERARQLARRMGELAQRIRELEPTTVPSGDADRSVVHGDFAPVNVIVDRQGEIVALLDLEHAGTGPRLLDVAWWGWVVRYHHPEAWHAAWPTFLAAAGLAPGTVEAQLRTIMLDALRDRASRASDPETRRSWLERRSVAEQWGSPAPDQAT